MIATPLNKSVSYRITARLRCAKPVEIGSRSPKGSAMNTKATLYSWHLKETFIVKNVNKTQMRSGWWNAFVNAQPPLHSLTKKEFEQLKKCGMLWELYPEAPERYEQIEE